MAKKGNRVQVILECTEHKNSGVKGTSRYVTTKNKKNTPDRLYYGLSKGGYISTSDTDVNNYAEIRFVDSVYNGEYKIFGY